MTFGEKLKDMRKRFCLTQEQLSEIVGVSRQTITKWETDFTLPDANNLQVLANVFGVSIDFLLGNDKLSLLVMRVELDRDKYKNKLGSYEMILKEYFSSCEIYNLVRSKKMSKLEAVLDFFVFGIHEDIDNLGDLSPYYLVKKDNSKLLVNIKDWVLEVYELPFDINEKKFVFNGNKFVNCGKLKLK